MKTIEYRIRPVTRFIVTKYTNWNNPPDAKCEETGEFDNEIKALNAISAFGDAETILAKPADKVIVTGDRVRTWTPRSGWDDNPEKEND